MNPTAHLYGRVSGEAQTHGHGLIRQMGPHPAKVFCERWNFDLSSKLWIDDGVSAFMGLNATPEHQLGKFLLAAQGRRGVHPGDCLLIENWDRFSRQHPRAGLRLIDDLCQAEIHVGRLDNGQLYRWDSEDTGELFGILAELARGHSESVMKSYRLRQLKADRRKAAREEGLQSRQPIPAWLRWNGQQLEPIPERQETLQLMFRWSKNGLGAVQIVHQLNREGRPTFRVAAKKQTGKRRKAERWTLAYVHKLMKDRRLLGEYQPTRTVREQGKKSRQIPEGEPIQGYYPAVITPEEWRDSRAAQQARRKRTGRPSARGFSLFQGLIYHPLSGKWHCHARAGRRQPVLQWSLSREQENGFATFPLEPFEKAFLHHLREIDPSSVLDSGAGGVDLHQLAGKLVAVESELAEVQAWQAAHKFQAGVAAREAALVEERRTLTEALKLAESRDAQHLAHAWADQKRLLDVWEECENKAELGPRLRSLFLETIEKVFVLVYARNEKNRIAAVQVWFHGGEKQRSWLLYYRSGYGTVSGRTDGHCWAASFPSSSRSVGDVFDLRSADDARELLALLTVASETE